MKNKNNLNLVLIISIFMVIACTCPKDLDQPTSNDPAPTAAETPKTTNSSSTSENTRTSTAGVNLANFNSIKTGMKYDEVVQILGKEGEVVSETEIMGYKTVLYKWDGSDTGSIITAMFQNGKIINKTQNGLK